MTRPALALDRAEVARHISRLRAHGRLTALQIVRLEAIAATLRDDGRFVFVEALREGGFSGADGRGQADFADFVQRVHDVAADSGFNFSVVLDSREAAHDRLGWCTGDNAIDATLAST